jgi:hypothetical protein
VEGCPLTGRPGGGGVIGTVVGGASAGPIAGAGVSRDAGVVVNRVVKTNGRVEQGGGPLPHAVPPGMHMNKSLALSHVQKNCQNLLHSLIHGHLYHVNIQ